MALVVRYFSTTANGLGNGTTWEDRAALFTTGNWSSVITGFAFNGSDALECRIGPGSYTCTQTLDSAKFTVAAPTSTNYLLLHGADSSGNRAAPTDATWVAAKGEWSTTGLPAISGHTAAYVSGIYSRLRLLCFSGSAASATLLSGGLSTDWCTVENTADVATSGSVVAPAGMVANCVFKHLGKTIGNFCATTACYVNCRVVGSSRGDEYGNRYAFYQNSGSIDIIRCCVVNAGWAAYNNPWSVRHCTFVGLKTGVTYGSTQMTNCYIANSPGFNANSLVVSLANTRLRNISGTVFTSFLNQPTDLSIYTDAGTDADEFVNAATGDYRMKMGSVYYGRNIGAGDQYDGPVVLIPQVSTTTFF